uniref:F-box domain-containing protein n=1 Tax=Plectus sambesii TaxID=2011161 RepID=A0A914W0T3_9BILA
MRNDDYSLVDTSSIESMATFETEVGRLQAENDRLRRALSDFCERVVCGRLTGDLPENFLEQFSQLPDRPLEQVLRFLPARQVAQMRHVSRRFNHLIRKCSKTMPKRECNGSVVFKNKHPGELTVSWFDDCESKIVKTTLADDEVALSELFRFIRVGGRIFFSDGLSAADKFLDQLSKAWLTIRPEVVVFSGDLSKTSRDSLRAFLVKVEPSISWLYFQDSRNIDDSLLSDDLIGAAGQLDGLMVLPTCWGLKLRDRIDIGNINIGDNTLLAMADTTRVSSYFSVMGCSGITPGGIRAFIENWMKQADAKSISCELTCELIFCKCLNVTPTTVKEACGDLFSKETNVGTDENIFGDSIDMEERVRYIIKCPSNRRLEILFHFYPYLCPVISEPGLDDEDNDLN